LSIPWAELNGNTELERGDIMVSTGAKHIDECTVRKKLSGYRGFDITVGWQCAEVKM